MYEFIEYSLYYYSYTLIKSIIIFIFILKIRLNKKLE